MPQSCKAELLYFKSVKIKTITGDGIANIALIDKVNTYVAIGSYIRLLY